jgi:hypothetical protein
MAKKPIIKKAQNGVKKSPVYKSPWGERTPDSTGYFKAKADDYRKASKNMEDEAFKSSGLTKLGFQNRAKALKDESDRATKNMERQSKKGQPGYDKYGRPKMKSGGKVMAKKTMKKK